MYRHVKTQIIHDDGFALIDKSDIEYCNVTHIDTLASYARIHYCQILDKGISLNHSNSGFRAGNRGARLFHDTSVGITSRIRATPET